MSLASLFFKSKALLVGHPDSPRIIEWDVDQEGSPHHADEIERNGLTFDEVDAHILIYPDATFEVVGTRHKVVGTRHKDQSAVVASIIKCRPDLSERPEDPLWNFS